MSQAAQVVPDVETPDALHELPIRSLEPEDALSRFQSILTRDIEQLQLPDYLHRWLFVERLYQRDERKEMNFYEFEGPLHIAKFMAWIMNTQFHNILSGEYLDTLIERSYQTDKKLLAQFDLAIPDDKLRNIGLYNAQDHIFQRAYQVSGVQQVKRFLDIGAGHGRMANLGLCGNESPYDAYVAVDGIPSSYLTQATYFKGLGLKVWDYFDHCGDVPDSIDFEGIAAAHDVVHIPTWRMDLIPEGYFDMVNCVQVLKELPGDLTAFFISEFNRVVQPNGAVYVRDHKQFHNPNHMPIDDLLNSSGFVLEYNPQIVDRKDVHGVPRIWRKFNAQNYL